MNFPNKSKEDKSKTFKWKLLDSKVVFEHPRIKIIEDKLKLPNTKIISYLRFSSNNDSMTVICIRRNKILLQNEYSYPVDEKLLQFPGGSINKDEDIINAASRELIEESGYKIIKAENVGWYYVNNRRTNSKMHVVTFPRFSRHD